MANNTRQIIARRFILYILISSFIIMIFAAIVQTYIAYESELKVIDDNYKVIENSNLPPLINSLWISDDVQIQSILDGILKTPSIEYLEIKNNDDT